VEACSHAGNVVQGAVLPQAAALTLDRLYLHCLLLLLLLCVRLGSLDWRLFVGRLLWLWGGSGGEGWRRYLWWWGIGACSEVRDLRQSLLGVSLICWPFSGIKKLWHQLVARGDGTCWCCGNLGGLRKCKVCPFAEFWERARFPVLIGPPCHLVLFSC
jgi:hypothetical protein